MKLALQGLTLAWHVGRDWLRYPECGTVWDADGKIGKDGKESICEWSFEGEVVGDFMNG